jgi:hypothetical protein
VINEPAASDGLIAHLDVLPRAVLQQRKAEDQAECPQGKQKNQREGAEISEKILASAARSNVGRDLAPGNPGAAIEPGSEAELPPHPPRENHRLEGIQENAEDDDKAQDAGKNVHGVVWREW